MKIIIGQHVFALDHRYLVPALLIEADWLIVNAYVVYKIRKRRKARRNQNHG